MSSDYQKHPVPLDTGEVTVRLQKDEKAQDRHAGAPRARDEEAREALAAIAHDTWARWLAQVIDRGVPTGNSSIAMKADDYTLWRKRATTPYSQLSEEEKESNREIAARMMTMLRVGYNWGAAPPEETRPAPTTPNILVPVPAVGRIVHYYAYGTPGGEFPAGVPRAAVIAEVEAPGFPYSRIKMCVLNPAGIFFTLGWASYTEDATPGGWGWPPFVPSVEVAPEQTWRKAYHRDGQ